MDIQPNESAAAIEAGRQAGQYLESIGKTDLAALSKEEWKTFCEVMCLNYVPADQIPY